MNYDDSIKVGCAPRRIVIDWPSAYVEDPDGVWYPVVIGMPECCRDCKHGDHCGQFVSDYVDTHRMTAFIAIIYPLGAS